MIICINQMPIIDLNKLVLQVIFSISSFTYSLCIDSGSISIERDVFHWCLRKEQSSFVSDISLAHWKQHQKVRGSPMYQYLRHHFSTELTGAGGSEASPPVDLLATFAVLHHKAAIFLIEKESLYLYWKFMYKEDTLFIWQKRTWSSAFVS